MHKNEVLPAEGCVAETCTPKECCTGKLKCDSHKCDWHTHKKDGNDRDETATTCASLTCTNEECCDANPSCGTHECSDGFFPRTNTLPCSRDTCHDNDCCDQAMACEKYECPKNYKDAPGKKVLVCKGIKCTPAQCCIEIPKTCGPYTGCAVGTHLRDDAEHRVCKGKCDPSQCCYINPTCQASYQCDDGYSGLLKKNRDTVCPDSECGHSDCCVRNQTCADKKCDANTTKKSGVSYSWSPTYCKARYCKNDECCEGNATCKDDMTHQKGGYGSGFGFGGGWNSWGVKTKGCPSNMAKVNDYDTKLCKSASCYTSDCCAGQEMCKDWQCPSGYHYTNGYKKVTCATNVCSATECCDLNPTCEGFECTKGQSTHVGTSGWWNPSHVRCKSPSCKSDECCNVHPTCNDFKTLCINGQVLKDGQEQCSTMICAVDECCIDYVQPTCKEHKCGDGFVKALDYYTKPACDRGGCTDGFCCESSNSCQSVNCGDDWREKNGYATNICQVRHVIARVFFIVLLCLYVECLLRVLCVCSDVLPRGDDWREKYVYATSTRQVRHVILCFFNPCIVSYCVSLCTIQFTFILHYIKLP
jgi:hypothetical protein